MVSPAHPIVPQYEIRRAERIRPSQSQHGRLSALLSNTARALSTIAAEIQSERHGYKRNYINYYPAKNRDYCPVLATSVLISRGACPSSKDAEDNRLLPNLNCPSRPAPDNAPRNATWDDLHSFGHVHKLLCIDYRNHTLHPVYNQFYGNVLLSIV